MSEKLLFIQCKYEIACLFIEFSSSAIINRWVELICLIKWSNLTEQRSKLSLSNLIYFRSLVINAHVLQKSCFRVFYKTHFHFPKPETKKYISICGNFKQWLLAWRANAKKGKKKGKKGNKRRIEGKKRRKRKKIKKERSICTVC
jgi:hypothetical protein